MGLNFAFTGDVALYHSKRDNLENLDKASLQHHGENMLAAVKAFGDKDMASLDKLQLTRPILMCSENL